MAYEPGDLAIKIDGYKLNIRAAGVIIHNGKILLHKGETANHYALLGGHVRIGENSQDTVKREIQEELGKEIEIIGIVKGSTIQTKNIGRDITQGFKSMVGGELVAYTQMLNEARALATKRMVEEAESLQADAVINVRYTSSMVAAGAAEILAYGTAVKVK